MMRPFNPTESAVLNAFAEQLPEEESVVLLADLQSAQALPKLADASIVEMQALGYAPESRQGYIYPIEAKMKTAQGSDVLVLFFHDQNQRFYELEFIVWGDEPYTELDFKSLNFYPGESTLPPPK